MPGLLCRFTSDGVIEYANGAYAQAFGTTPDALPGKSFLDRVPEAEGFFGTLQDITHRMLADAELRDSEAMYGPCSRARRWAS